MKSADYYLLMNRKLLKIYLNAIRDYLISL